jgi:hypothetical protein
MAAQGLPVQVCWGVLAVSESGCSAWRNRPPSVGAIRHGWLTDAIRQVHAAPRQTYGSRRVQPSSPWAMAARSATTPWSC